MKELVNDSIESLLSDVVYDVRSGKRLMALVGILGQAGVPEDVLSETLKLSKYIVLREIFTSLIEPISSSSKRRDFSRTEQQPASLEINFNSLYQQLDETRKQLAEFEAINYPIIISWVVSQAKKQRLLRSR